MRRVEYDRFGDPSVLTVREVADPAPRRGEVLVRVRAAALNPKDVLLRKGRLRWLVGGGFPRVAGYDFAGEIERVGDGVEELEAGQRVFGMLSSHRGGALATALLCSPTELALIPDDTSFVEAAGVPLAGLTALQALRDCGRVKHDDRVLINGASGGVGVYAIQIARVLGARVSTLSSAANIELCRNLGAIEAFDYAVDEPAPTAPWDCFFDAYGNRSFAAVRPSLAPLGTYVTTVPAARNVIDHVRTAVGFPRARLVVVESVASDLELLAQWMTAGYIRPVIDSVFALDAIQDAQRRVETRRARGKVVVEMP